MATHVALLRGINLGARNRIAMPDLRVAVGSLGYDDVSTYIQSGNVLFSTRQDDTQAIQTAIRDVISASFGLNIGVVVVSRDELATVISRNPYPVEPEPKWLHVVFLPAAPDEALLGKLAVANERAAGIPHEVTADGRVLYLYTPKGFGTSDLAKAVVKAAATGTARNWTTTTKLLELCG